MGPRTIKTYLLLFLGAWFLGIGCICRCLGQDWLSFWTFGLGLSIGLTALVNQWDNHEEK